jgi:hypothetical protein
VTKPVILIATTIYGNPTTGTVHNAYHMATMRLCRNAELEFVPLTAFVQADIVRARSGLVRDFLAHPNATHLLFWDEDVVAEPEVLAALIKALIESGHDYVGVPYPKKKIQWAKVWDWFYLNQRRPEPGEIDRVAFEYTAVPNEPTAEDLARGDGLVATRLVNGFAELTRMGLGFTLVSRACCERMVAFYGRERTSAVDATETPTFLDTGRDGKPVPTVALFQLLVRDGLLLTDDYSFCERWRDIGGWIHMYAGPHKLQHVGAFAYGRTE